jgi:uncharacterized membrane protein (DUF2068 family)
MQSDAENFRNFLAWYLWLYAACVHGSMYVEIDVYKAEHNPKCQVVVMLNFLYIHVCKMLIL